MGPRLRQNVATLGDVWQSFLDVVYFKNPNSTHVLYYALGLVALGTLFLATSASALKSNGRLGRYVDRIRPCQPYLWMMIGIMTLVSFELAVERGVTSWVNFDFTPWVFAVEGNSVQHVQSFLHDGPLGGFLDALLIPVYTWISMLLEFLPFLIVAFMGHAAAARRVALTELVVWTVGVLFYLFVPVYEVWVTSSPPYNYGTTAYLLGEKAPELDGSRIAALNINNNLPSLHVAATSAMALALYRGRERWLAAFAIPAAALVALATVYLGIHWVTDVVTGVGLAVGASWTYEWWERRRTASSLPVSAVEPAAASTQQPAPMPALETDGRHAFNPAAPSPGPDAGRSETPGSTHHR